MWGPHIFKDAGFKLGPVVGQGSKEFGFEMCLIFRSLVFMLGLFSPRSKCYEMELVSQG